MTDKKIPIISLQALHDARLDRDYDGVGLLVTMPDGSLAFIEIPVTYAVDGGTKLHDLGMTRLEQKQNAVARHHNNVSALKPITIHRERPDRLDG